MREISGQFIQGLKRRDQMQKREIKNRIKTVKCYKDRIKQVSNSLFNEHKAGKISYPEYFFRLSKFLKGRTE